jgi:hypothetical protein
MNQIVQPHHIDAAKVVGDIVSLSAIAGALMNFITPLSALVGLVYICIRVWETDTVQKLIKRYRKDKTNGEEKS